MREFAVCFAFLLIGRVWATSEDLLNGIWVRVGDGCRQLNSDEVSHLGSSGGTNAMNRRIALRIEGSRFWVTSFPSLKCEKDFRRKGIDFQNNYMDCQPAETNTGSVEFPSANHFVLNAEHGDHMRNPWGYIYRDFEYEVLDSGYVLKLIPEGDGNHCPSATKYIYLITTPTS